MLFCVKSHIVENVRKALVSAYRAYGTVRYRYLFPQYFRIYSLILHRLQCRDHVRFIFFVCYTVPFVIRSQDFALCTAVPDETVGNIREEVFTLKGILLKCGFEEGRKSRYDFIDEICRKSPKIHGYNIVAVSLDRKSVV